MSTRCCGHAAPGWSGDCRRRRVRCSHGDQLERTAGPDRRIAAELRRSGLTAATPSPPTSPTSPRRWSRAWPPRRWVRSGRRAVRTTHPRAPLAAAVPARPEGSVQRGRLPIQRAVDRQAGPHRGSCGSLLPGDPRRSCSAVTNIAIWSPSRPTGDRRGGAVRPSAVGAVQLRHHRPPEGYRPRPRRHASRASESCRAARRFGSRMMCSSGRPR